MKPVMLHPDHPDADIKTGNKILVLKVPQLPK
jgi:hypothetical protein